MTWRTAWNLARRRPGPWLLLASLAGWALLALPGLEVTPAMSHHDHHAATHHAGIGAWLAMLLAMAPLVLRSEVALIWQNNLRRQRWIAIPIFMAGYSLPWLALGLVWLWLIAGQPISGAVLFAALIAVLAWQCSPLRQRCLNLCHRPPRLRAFGSGMPVDAARFGLRAGALCSAICGPGMLFAMALPAYHLVTMLGVMALATVERSLPARRPAWRLPGLLGSREPHWQSLNVMPPPPVETA